MEALSAADEPAVRAALPEILRLLSDPDPEIRAEAVDLLVDHPSPEAVPQLIARLADADETVRSLAAEALEQLGRGAAPAIPALIRLSQDPSRFVRGSAIEALGAIGTPEAMSALNRLLGGPDAGPRAHAAEVLACFGAAAVPALTRALDDGDAPVRRAAALALGEIGPAAGPAVPRLSELAGEGRSWLSRLVGGWFGDPVRNAAAEALGRIRRGP